ncbi:MAG: MgtC/SapB family protein [Clostridiales bacterium]|nr:MgtC/SapB family protein [Clostridiales bacterium]
MAWWEAGARLLLAVVLGCIVGIERERKNRPAGMRTHVLVCVGAAVIAVLEQYLVADVVRMNLTHQGDTGIGISLGRISAQVISGIGFLGAGTIFISQKKIGGLTTAASLWNVGCLGLAVGMGYYLLSIAACIIVVITLTMLQRVVKVNAIKSVEVKFIKRIETLAFINEYFSTHQIKVLDVDFHVNNQGDENIYTNVYTLDMGGRISYTQVISDLSELTNIRAIRTRNT